MTVKQLRNLLKGLPSNMSVCMFIDEETIGSVCAENSEVVEIEMEGNADELHETELLLLLVPCAHECEKEIGELNSQPELN